ncbi:MAG: hypothetical protein M0016_02815 [Deltaproteobacteria bacterium]|jgi:flagellar export protein FliJ|nr:hypothetical protein [Deltaproteobacteria bacterium]MCL5879663.1 hypothetical protein [Deltaproteobacteria bacterium]MDA8304078.1 hypothetical protein [Deltaproteobacteria bacterium]
MAAFKFQNILNHRKLILDEHYIELSRVQDELVKINLRINSVQNSINLFKETFPDKVLNITNINDYNSLDAQYRTLLAKLDDLLKIKDSISVDLENKKAQTISARVECEKIDKLREKYLAINKITELKHDEAIANDFASNRHNQR